MHLFILNPGSAVATTQYPYQGGRHVNDYSSLIWTERFRDYGEFQINIPRNAGSSDIFWPGLLVGIQESNQVMLAETQQELVNDQGYIDVVVRGRSAESILEDRVLWAPQGGELTLARQYSDLDAALLYIWGAVLNDTTSDVGYTVARPSQISASSKISDAILTDSVYKGVAFPLEKRVVSLGQMGPTIRKFLLESNYGLRCIRPTSNVSGLYSVTVDPVNGANKGLITKTLLSGTTDKLRFDVYAGVDRSVTTPATDQLIYLSGEAGHLDNIDVATTYKEFITHTVHGVDITHYYGYTTGLPVRSDFFTRQRFVDASAVTNGLPEADWPGVVGKQQKLYFQTHTNRAILTADLTSNTPFVFGTHYNLGDTVKLRYKTRTRRSLVTEYTRIDDAEGHREYPSFVAWDEITSGVLNDW